MDFFKISIDDFKNLDLLSKGILITTLLTMPFWYSSLYLFHKSFYNLKDISIKVIMTFCLSTSWTMAHFFAFPLCVDMTTKENISKSMHRWSKMSGFVTVFSLALMMFIHFVFHRLGGYQSFLYECYGLLLTWFIPAFIFGFIRLFKEGIK